jgi:hypothetical protein
MTSELLREIKRGQYTLWLVKKIPQRPEHMITATSWYPKVYPYKFITLHKWEKIPEHFNDIFHIIIRKGSIDGSIYGLYSLVLHGRGKRFSQTNPEEVRYRAGADFVFTASKGLRITEINFHQSEFLRLLHTIKEVNSKLR